MTRRYLVVLALAIPSPLSAQDSVHVLCDSAETTAEYRRCSGFKLRSALRDLEPYLQEARRVAANRALLDSSQTAWERYRDVECRAAKSVYEGGSMQPLIGLDCWTDLTRDRMRELYRAYMREGDGPLPEPKP